MEWRYRKEEYSRFFRHNVTMTIISAQGGGHMAHPTNLCKISNIDKDSQEESLRNKGRMILTMTRLKLSKNQHQNCYKELVTNDFIIWMIKQFEIHSSIVTTARVGETSTATNLCQPLDVCVFDNVSTSHRRRLKDGEVMTSSKSSSRTLSIKDDEFCESWNDLQPSTIRKAFTCGNRIIKKDQ